MVQVYDELKQGARCPTMINENLKVGNSLVSAISPEQKIGFIARDELEKYQNEVMKLIKLRGIERSIDVLGDEEIKELIRDNFADLIDIYIHIKEKYPNAIPTPQQKLLDEWHRRAKKEPIEKTFDILISQTGLARVFLKELYFERFEKIKEKIENEINKPLIKYFNSKKKVLKDNEMNEILKDEEKVKDELRYIKERAIEISKSQPPKVFNWEIEFLEVFFDEDGSLKENPGFDCVVGNPPYINIYELTEILSQPQKEYLMKNYYVSFKKFDIYMLFTERGQSLLNTGGAFGFIIPSSWMYVPYGEKLRQNLLRECKIEQLIYLGREVFGRGPSAPSNITMLLITRKESSVEGTEVFVKLCEDTYLNVIKKIAESSSYNRILLTEEHFCLPQDLFWTTPKYTFRVELISEIKKVIEHLNNISLPLHEICYIGRGLTFGAEYHKVVSKFKSKLLLKPFAKGKDITRYHFVLPRTTVIKKDIMTYLPPKELFENKKLIFPKIKEKLCAALDDRGIYIDSTGICCVHYHVFNPDSKNISKNLKEIKLEYVLACVNSSLLNFYFIKFLSGLDIVPEVVGALPIYPADKDHQAPIISLVDKIIQKKKEYHSISQNIEDYIDFRNTKLIRLDEFLRNAVRDFEVSPSLRVKRDNFDALRAKIDGENAIIEYGVRRKIDEFEFDEETAEIRGKYVIEWHLAGQGKIKDNVVVEFLAEILEHEKRISKAKTKTVWEKIAEVKVPEFTEDVKTGFLKFKHAIEKAKELDKEIIKIDRAIDRLVYDLYGLNEDEIKVVEKSVWGEKFDEMYSKLPSRGDALKLAEV
jgi:hypothetical protein